MRRVVAPFGFALLVAAALAAPVQAQTTGMVKGQVVDGQSQPVEGARITIEYLEGVTRRIETKTNKKGEFIQIGMPVGQYRIIAEKEGLGRQQFDARVRLGDPTVVNFVLEAGKSEPTKEDAAKSEALKKIFAEGVELARAGKHDEAIARFREALTLAPSCADCHYNIGAAYAQKKDYANAETAFKTTIALKSDYLPAYNGLTSIYNAQRRFDDAAAITAQAAKLGPPGGASGNVEALYNQAVVFWNAGKIAEAKQQFAQVIASDPSHADAHYWLGMANLNEGTLAEAATEFETYLKLAPQGQYAEQARGVLSQIKK
ncbi:MAG: tetratricopeptide repeat protein [Acidobacteria bacterium]|nr:tetratricopeptide repeat protein [Acidobacteriota bacterium]